MALDGRHGPSWSRPPAASRSSSSRSSSSSTPGFRISCVSRQLAEDAARDLRQLVDGEVGPVVVEQLLAHDRPRRADGAAEEFGGHVDADLARGRSSAAFSYSVSVSNSTPSMSNTTAATGLGSDMAGNIFAFRRPRNGRRRLRMRRLLPMLLMCCSRPPAPPSRRRRAAAVAEAARPLPRLVVEARGAAADRSAKTSMVLLAVQEWARYGRQTITYPANGPARTEQQGVKERDAPRAHQRLLEERRQAQPQRPRHRGAVVGRLHLLGHRERRRSARSVLSRRAPHDLCRAHGRARPPAGRRVRPAPSERAGAAGRRPDLRLARRRRHDPGKPRIADPGHCDIVVEVRPGEVHAIGGNVANSVTRSVFPLDASGFLSPISARQFFTVIENRLP